MGAPRRHRFCSLAAAGLLTACGGQATRDYPSANTGGTRSGGGSDVAGAGGAAAGGAGGAAAASARGGTPGVIVVPSTGGSAGAGGAGCRLDCSDFVGCGNCIASDGPSDTCRVGSVNGSPLVGVSFDCSPLTFDEDFTTDAQGNIVLLGEACAALEAGGPHRIDLVLGCPLDR